MFRQFKFEEPLYQKLDRIPVSTQFKLESLGLNLSLAAWNQLPLEEKWVLCHLPVRSRGDRECYNQYLSYLLKREKLQGSSDSVPTAAQEKKPWEDLQRLPPEVAQKMKDLNLPLYWPEWIKLDDMERYTLFKLCRDNAELAQIQQVVQEFLGVSNLSTPAS